MEHTYRHILAADLPILKSLLAVFGEAFGEPGTYQGAVPSDAYLEALLGKPHFIALAALRGGEVVGGLAAYQLEKFEQARSEIYIYDLAVREADRRKGVATGLIRALGRIAEERGAYSCMSRRIGEMIPPSGSTNPSGRARRSSTSTSRPPCHPRRADSARFTNVRDRVEAR